VRRSKYSRCSRLSERDGLGENIAKPGMMAGMIWNLCLNGHTGEELGLYKRLFSPQTFIYIVSGSRSFSWEILQRAIDCYLPNTMDTLEVEVVAQLVHICRYFG
jgi:hypothetical protein